MNFKQEAWKILSHVHSGNEREDAEIKLDALNQLHLEGVREKLLILRERFVNCNNKTLKHDESIDLIDEWLEQESQKEEKNG